MFGQSLVFHIFEVAKVEKSYFTLIYCGDGGKNGELERRMELAVAREGRVIEI